MGSIIARLADFSNACSHWAMTRSFSDISYKLSQPCGPRSRSGRSSQNVS